MKIFIAIIIMILIVTGCTLLIVFKPDNVNDNDNFRLTSKSDFDSECGSCEKNGDVINMIIPENKVNGLKEECYDWCKGCSKIDKGYVSVCEYKCCDMKECKKC